MEANKPKVLQAQVGGDHYAKYPIQPIEYIHANMLDFAQGNIVKLITRFRDKGGAQDLHKIKQYAGTAVRNSVLTNIGLLMYFCV